MTRVFAGPLWNNDYSVSYDGDGTIFVAWNGLVKVPVHMKSAKSGEKGQGISFDRFVCKQNILEVLMAP